MFDQETAADALRHIQMRIRQYDAVNQDPTDVIEVVGESPATPTEVTNHPPTTVTKSNIWHHPDAHPVALDVALLGHYGPQYLQWEAETLKRVVPEDFQTSSLSELNLAKIQVVKTLHLVDSYWDDWEVFLWCSMPMNNLFPDFGVLQAPTAAQCLVSIDIANHLRDDVPWSDEVKAFIEVSFRHDGLYEKLEPANFITIQCGPNLANFKYIEDHWPKVRDTKKAPKGETPEDEQLRRMLSAHEYLEENRARLRHQMKLVSHA